MALHFVDSFGHYSQADLDEKWDEVATPSGTTSGTFSHSATGGRAGHGKLIFGASTNDVQSGRAELTHVDQFVKRNHSGLAVVHVGLAVEQNAVQLTQGSRLLTFLDGATTQVGIDIMPSGQLRAVRATSAGSGIYLVSADPHSGESGLYTVLGTSPGAISSSSYDYLEFKITHHGTTGIIEVKKNGSAFWTLSDQNTAISGSNNSASVLVGGYGALVGGSGANVQNHFLRANVSDFYLLDTTGAFANTFIGDVVVEPLSPTADGNYEEWALSAGSDSFALIDDAAGAIDGDATYISSGTLDQRSTFVTSNSVAPTGGAVVAVVVTMYCKKDDGGSNLVAGMARLAGTDGVGTNADVPGTYAFRQSFIYEKPGGGAWTVADVNDAEFGVKKTS